MSDLCASTNMMADEMVTYSSESELSDVETDSSMSFLKAAVPLRKFDCFISCWTSLFCPT